MSVGLESPTARMKKNPALYYPWSWNNAALNALLTDQEYRSPMLGTANILILICDEILRCSLTFSAELTEVI